MKNTLVQYQGGGYDGCFWEWNFFFFDNNGEFHNIFSSGRNGITTKKQVAELLSQDDKDVYCYDLTKDKNIDELSAECNVVDLAELLQWFTDNPQDGIEFYVRCSDCSEKIDDLSECSLENWHGCGGIQSTADKVLCPECLSKGTCDCCQEYVGEDNLVSCHNLESEPAAQRLIDHGHDVVCTWCYEDQQQEQVEQEQRDDLVWQAFTTGKPDIFSDEMRWFWADK